MAGGSGIKSPVRKPFCFGDGHDPEHAQCKRCALYHECEREHLRPPIPPILEGVETVDDLPEGDFEEMTMIIVWNYHEDGSPESLNWSVEHRDWLPLEQYFGRKYAPPLNYEVGGDPGDEIDD